MLNIFVKRTWYCVTQYVSLKRAYQGVDRYLPLILRNINYLFKNILKSLNTDPLNISVYTRILISLCSKQVFKHETMMMPPYLYIILLNKTERILKYMSCVMCSIVKRGMFSYIILQKKPNVLERFSLFSTFKRSIEV